MQKKPHDKNADAVRQAVADSVKAGTVTPELFFLIQEMARIRTAPEMAADIAQNVALRVLANLDRIDLSRDVYNYLGVGIVHEWQRIMKHRKAERNWTVREMCRQLDEVQADYRGAARGQAFASFESVSRLKYYA